MPDINEIITQKRSDRRAFYAMLGIVIGTTLAFLFHDLAVRFF